MLGMVTMFGYMHNVMHCYDFFSIPWFDKVSNMRSTHLSLFLGRFSRPSLPSANGMVPSGWRGVHPPLSNGFSKSTQVHRFGASLNTARTLRENHPYVSRYIHQLQCRGKIVDFRCMKELWTIIRVCEMQIDSLCKFQRKPPLCCKLYNLYQLHFLQFHWKWLHKPREVNMHVHCISI